MELLLPSSKPLEQLELFQKRILKQILSLPMSCSDPAVYILIRILPIEAIGLDIVFHRCCSDDT
jgi:hypothetical protein